MMKKLSMVAALLCCALQPTIWANSSAEADKLLNVMGVEQAMQQSMDQMLAIQLQQDPAMAPFAGVMQQFLAKHMSWESLKPEFVRIYAQAFTESELRELIAFYQTEVGQKSIEKMPELMAQGAQIGTMRVQENQMELIELITKEMERLGLEP